MAIAHEARIAADRATTAREVRHARVARSAADAIAGAVLELETLVLADRAAALAARARGNPLAVPATVTPVERAWVLCWHLLAATARVHGAAFAAGRPRFGERETANALAFTRDALRELESLLAAGRRLELHAALTPSALSFHAQWRLFAPALPVR